MLSIEALNATRDLVAVLSDKNVDLIPVPGSPVEGLTSVTRKEVNYGISCLSQIDAMVLDIHAMNKTEIVDGEIREDLHSGYLGTNAVTLGNALANHVSHAMNVVLPATAELHTRLCEIRDENACTGPKAYQIVPVRSAAIFDLQEITDVLEEMGRLKSDKEIKLVLDFKEMDDEALLDILKVGASTYDEALASFVSQCGIEMVRYVWREVFTSARSMRTFDAFRSSQDRENLQTLAFLFALRLWSNDDSHPDVDGSAGLTRSQYKIQLRNLMEVAGLSCFYSWERSVTDERAGRLIKMVKGREVHVDARVYERYLSEGGSADAVLGAAITSDEKNLPAMLEQREKFEEAWKYQIAIERSTSVKDQLVNSRREIVQYVRNYVLANKENDPVIAQNSRGIIARVIKMVETIFQPALENLHMVALTVICDAIFNHTDAKCILTSYQRAITDNPELSQQQAMDVAMVDYVADWFAEQVCVR